MYSIKLDDDSEKKTAKSIVRNAIKNHFKHDNYKQTLETGDRMNSSMKMIRSFDHQYIYCECDKEFPVSLMTTNDIFRIWGN